MVDRKTRMDLGWTADPAPSWDADRKRIVGAWPGSFPELATANDGAPLPGRWWSAERGAARMGFGWMDVTWGDAEVWLAVSPDMARTGVGSFILDRLVEEARKQGLRYMYNRIPPSHPDPSRLTSWLERRSFGLSGDGLYKRLV